MDKLIERYCKCRSVHFIKSVHDLLKAITLVDTPSYFKKEKRRVFDEYVEKVNAKFPNEHYIDDEELQKSFNYRKYEKVELVGNLIYYKVGELYTQTFLKAPSAKLLDQIESSVKFGFYLGFKLDKVRILDIIEDIGSDLGYIFANIESSSNEREELEKFCKNCIRDTSTDDEIIKQIDMYNDGGYIILPESIQLINYQIVTNDYWSCWLYLISKLKFFPLQGALIYMLQTVDDCINALRTIQSSDIDRKKIIVYLLRNRFFSVLCEEYERLENNCNSDSLQVIDKHNERLRLWNDWKSGIPRLIHMWYDITKSILGLSEMASWYSLYKQKLESRPSNFIKKELWGIHQISPFIADSLKDQEMDVDNVGLTTLLLFAKEASCQTLNQNYYKNLVEAIVKQIYHARYLEPLRLDGNGLENLRSIYRCLEKAELDGIDIFHSYRDCFEGYKTDFKTASRSAEGDTFWLSVLMLELEESKNQETLRYLYNWIIDSTILDNNSIRDDYFSPLYIAELIVTQVLPDEKDAFESAVINNIPNLALVLRIIAENRGVMSSENRKALSTRITDEWNLEKMLFNKTNQKQLEFLEKYVNQLNS